MSLSLIGIENLPNAYFTKIETTLKREDGVPLEGTNLAATHEIITTDVSSFDVSCYDYKDSGLWHDREILKNLKLRVKIVYASNKDSNNYKDLVLDIINGASLLEPDGKIPGQLVGPSSDYQPFGDGDDFYKDSQIDILASGWNSSNLHKTQQNNLFLFTHTFATNLDFAAKARKKHYNDSIVCIMAHTFLDIESLKDQYDCDFGFTDKQYYFGPLTVETLYLNGEQIEETSYFVDKETNQTHYGPVHQHETHGWMAGSFHSSESHRSLIRKTKSNDKIIYQEVEE
jgi:hypothetical protein